MNLKKQCVYRPWKGHGFIMKIYYCGKEDCRPGHFFGPAIRSHYLLHFILEGQGYYKIKEELLQVKAGEAFLIRPGEVTYYEADRKRPWSYAWIAFDGPDSMSLLEERGFTGDDLVGKVDENKKEKVNRLLGEIVTVFDEPNHDEKELLGYFYLIMSCMEKREEGKPSEYDKGYLKKSIDYIHHNYSYNINISDVARHVGIDRTYLYRIYMRYKKVSPKQYLMAYRLLVAKDMLEHTDYQITEIALSAGFHDASSFCKIFQRAEKMAPLMYRKAKRRLNS